MKLHQGEVTGTVPWTAVSSITARIADISWIRHICIARNAENPWIAEDICLEK